MSDRKKRVGAVLLAVAAVTLVALELQDRFELEEIVAHEERLRTAVDEAPLFSWVVGWAVYTLVSTIPGTSGKSIVCGWIFGFWPALLMVSTSLPIAAAASFLVSRYLLRGLIERRLESRVERLDRKLREDGAFTLVSLRLLHAPFTLLNYSAGATALGLRTFFWATLVGLLPSNAIFVGLGSTLPDLARLQQKGATELSSPMLLALLGLVTISPFALRPLIDRYGPTLGRWWNRSRAAGGR